MTVRTRSGLRAAAQAAGRPGYLTSSRVTDDGAAAERAML
jgi:hypothetical protein